MATDSLPSFALQPLKMLQGDACSLKSEFYLSLAATSYSRHHNVLQIIAWLTSQIASLMCCHFPLEISAIFPSIDSLLPETTVKWIIRTLNKKRGVDRTVIQPHTPLRVSKRLREKLKRLTWFSTPKGLGSVWVPLDALLDSEPHPISQPQSVDSGSCEASLPNHTATSGSIYPHTEFEILAASNVPRKPRSYRGRKHPKRVRLQVPSLQCQQTGAGNPSESSSCLDAPHVAAETAAQPKQILPTCRAEQTMSCCADDLGNALDRRIPSPETMAYPQGTSVASHDGYNCQEAPSRFFKQVNIHGSQFYYPEGNCAPSPVMEPPGGHAVGTQNLIVDLCMRRDDQQSAAMLRNGSTTPRPLLHSDPDDASRANAVCLTRPLNANNPPCNPNLELAYKLAYPTTHSLLLRKGYYDYQQSIQAVREALRQSRNTVPGVCPQGIKKTTGASYQKPNLIHKPDLIPNATFESLAAHGQRRIQSIDAMNSVPFGEQSLYEQTQQGSQSYRHDCASTEDQSKDQLPVYVIQTATEKLRPEDISSNLHAPPVTPQSCNWKEITTEKVASCHQLTQAYPLTLCQSTDAQVHQSTQQVSLPLPKELPSHLARISASVVPQTGTLQQHNPSKPLFDLNKVPEKELKGRRRKHRPRVARDKPPRLTPAAKKNVKVSTPKPKSRNRKTNTGDPGLVDSLKDRLEPPGQTSYSPRGNCSSSNFLLTSMIRQVGNMPCEMASRPQQTSYVKHTLSSNGFSELGKNGLLLKENSTSSMPVNKNGSWLGASSCSQALSNFVNIPPESLTGKKVRRKRGVDAENPNPRAPSKSKRKLQRALKVPLDASGAFQASAYGNYDTVISPIPDGPHKGRMPQTGESSINYAHNSMKRKIMVPTGVSYVGAHACATSYPCNLAATSYDPVPLQSLETSTHTPLDCGNVYKQRSQQDLPMSTWPFVHTNLAERPHDIEVCCNSQQKQANGCMCISKLPLTHLSSLYGASDNIMESLIESFEALKLGEPSDWSQCLDIIQYNNPGQDIVSYEGPFNPLRKKKLRPKVMLDMESHAMWKLLMGKECANNEETTECKWTERRAEMKKKVEKFIIRMHSVQGDRRFSQWKGSVVDSVVGAFLTQNVSDHLSSSAFMAMAARFPIRKVDLESDSQLSMCQNHAETGVPSLHVCDRHISTECSCQETNIFPVNYLYKIPPEKVAFSPGSPPLYELEGLQSSSKDIEYQCTPDSSESIMRVKSPNAKKCYAEDQVELALPHSLERFKSVFYSYHNEDSNVLQPETENSTSTPLERSVNSNFYMTSTEKSSRTVRRQLFKEDCNQGVEDDASCITGLSSEQSKLVERSITKYQDDIQQQRTIIPCTYVPETNNSDSIIEVRSNNGHSHDLQSMEGNTTISITKNRFTEEHVRSDQIGYVRSCTTISHQDQGYLHDYICGSVEAENSYLEQSACDGTPLKENINLTSSGHLSPENQEIPCNQALTTLEEQNASNYSQLTSKCLETVPTDGDGADIQVVEKLLTAKLSGVERARLEERQGGSKSLFDWESLRRKSETSTDLYDDVRQEYERGEVFVQDGVDWSAVRLADVKDVAEVIKERGMNNILAGRIKAFLERLHTDHGELNLEWLRKIPSDDAKNFLLSVRGLGLKSVECIRLLTLHHLAFPVDTNVGRICVRLGWVPIEPLPEELQIHLLELYPVQATIQKYLWPRLCTLDQRTLYELHYQMITFGKVFCTKSRPNCNACPMKDECKHFSSAFASAKLALPAPEQKEMKDESALLALQAGETEYRNYSRLALLPPEDTIERQNVPMLALPAPDDEISPQSQLYKLVQSLPKTCEPIIEEPASPETYCLEDLHAFPGQPSTPYSDDNYIINVEESAIQLTRGLGGDSLHLQLGNSTSKDLILMSADQATIPVPKLKNVGRLRTVHYVYEIPDNHELLSQMDTREADDPCCYLLAIWSPGESLESPPTGLDQPNDLSSCSAGCSPNPISDETVRGTLLVPCRTAMRGTFPLNGTYFQVNEVFADHESSLNPIEVSRSLLWNLRRKFVYFGTSIPSIFRGLTREEIKACFWEGYVCVRGFERRQRAPKPLAARLHFPASKRVVSRKAPSDGQKP